MKRNAYLDLAAKMGREFRCRAIAFIPLLGGSSTRASSWVFDSAAFGVFFKTLTAFCEAISLGRLNTSPDMALANANFRLFPWCTVPPLPLSLFNHFILALILLFFIFILFNLFFFPILPVAVSQSQMIEILRETKTTHHHWCWTAGGGSAIISPRRYSKLLICESWLMRQVEGMSFTGNELYVESRIHDPQFRFPTSIGFGRSKLVKVCVPDLDPVQPARTQKNQNTSGRIVPKSRNFWLKIPSRSGNRNRFNTSVSATQTVLALKFFQ